MTEPTVKITGLAYVRLQAPDLDEMAEFLTDFGLFPSARTEDALYMRGTDPSHHIHITHRGEVGFRSVAYAVKSEADLDALAKLPDASPIEDINEPGGGKRVRLREPNNGFLIEAVHGIEKPAPIPITVRPLNWTPEILSTIPEPWRLQFGPSRVKRLSHSVFPTPRLKETVAWFRSTFGLLPTDEFYSGDRSNVVGSFNRVDLGDEPVDHHVLNCYRSDSVGMQHVSFIVQDIDDIFVGHNHLTRLGKYEHMRGVGYHPPGGRIYDYWLSPWGQMHEHYMMTRTCNAATPLNLLPAPKEADPNSRFAKTIMAEVGH